MTWGPSYDGYGGPSYDGWGTLYNGQGTSYDGRGTSYDEQDLLCDGFLVKLNPNPVNALH